MESTMGGFMPFPNIDELGKQNMAMMERAMSLFVPFGRREEGPADVDALKAEVESLRRELASLREAKPRA
jgi:polyhydroxyalkanoate synthesis regulator protein